jgi:Family of unknown function (DUF5522)
MKSKAPKEPTKRLIEGEDFYWDKGLFVFTEAYHKARGYCCESGCRHCPYKVLKEKKPT